MPSLTGTVNAWGCKHQSSKPQVGGVNTKVRRCYKHQGLKPVDPFACLEVQVQKVHGFPQHYYLSGYSRGSTRPDESV